MTVINIQSKISDWDIPGKASEKEIRNVLAIVRIIIFPIKLARSIGIYRSMVFIAIAMRLQIFNFKRNFNKYSEFEKMDGLSEIMFMRESLNTILIQLKEFSSKSINFPLSRSITNRLTHLYNYLSKIELKYHRLVYSDAPDSNSEEFKKMLKEEYSGFELED